MVRKPPFWWLAIPVLLMVFAYGGLNLNTTPIFDDEWDSVDDVGGVFSPARSFTDIALNLAEANPWHAPGFYWVMKVWSSVSGPEPAALRVLTLLTGALCVALIYRLGAMFGSNRMGLIAAVLLGASILFVFYLAKVRMYIQLVLLTQAVIYFYFAYWRQRQAWLLVALTVSVTGLLYTHYISIAALAALGVYHVLYKRLNRDWWYVALAVVMGGLFFLPWFRVLIAGVESETTLARQDISSLEVIQNFLTVFGNDSLVMGILLIGLGTLLAVKTTTGRRLLLLALTTLAILIVLNETVTPMSRTRLRYLLVLWPSMILLVAYGVDQLQQRISGGKVAGTALIIVFAGVGIFATVQRSLSVRLDGFDYLFPMHTVHQQVGGLVQGDDILVYYLPDESTEGAMKFGRENAANYDLFTQGRHFVTMTEFYPGQAGEEQRFRTGLADSAGRLWLASQPNRQLTGLLEFREALTQTHLLCPVTARHSNVTVEQYVRYSSICCVTPDNAAPPRLQFGDWFRLVDSDISHDADSELLDVVLAWHMQDGAPLHAYSATLQLFDDRGDKVAQQDYGLDATAFACNRIRFDLAALHPGSYQLAVAVYNWQTGESLLAYDPVTGASATMLALDSVVVDR